MSSLWSSLLLLRRGEAKIVVSEVAQPISENAVTKDEPALTLSVAVLQPYLASYISNVLRRDKASRRCCDSPAIDRGRIVNKMGLLDAVDLSIRLTNACTRQSRLSHLVRGAQAAPATLAGEANVRRIRR